MKNPSKTIATTLAALAIALLMATLAAPSATAGGGAPVAGSAEVPQGAADSKATGGGDFIHQEELHYRWHLGSLLGRLAGLFLPSKGDGVLTIEPAAEGEHLRSELMITSEESRDGEFWRYGSKLERDSGHAVEAWSAYRWRGESKEKREEIAADGVMDVVSGIYAIRRDPPAKPRQMEIWSDGKLYPVVVVPLGEEKHALGDRQVVTRHYSIRGYSVPGKREWKGSLELWLALDAAATPVEIRIQRKLADLRLELQPSA